MKKHMRCLALLLGSLLLLSGCTSSPPDTLVRKDTDASRLVSADTRSLSPDSIQASLYFRYKDSGYLAPEERELHLERNETAEKRLVQALIDGPMATHSFLNPLFPPGTEILAVTLQNDTLFITFNEAFLGRYSDEPADISQEPWKTEFSLRRHLCTDALAATLTEAGLCARVQVLVYQEKNQSNSMRLQAGFYDRSGDGALLPALNRREDRLLTPHNAASAILHAWMIQDWPFLYDLVAKEDLKDPRPDEPTALSAFSVSQALTGFLLSPGNVAPSGQIAYVSADLNLRAQGNDLVLNGFPLRLCREEGLWKIPYSCLMAMMNQK